MGTDSKVLSVRLSSEMLEKIKLEAVKEGLSPSVFVRSMLYKKFTANT